MKTTQLTANVSQTNEGIHCGRIALLDADSMAFMMRHVFTISDRHSVALYLCQNDFRSFSRKPFAFLPKNFFVFALCKHKRVGIKYGSGLLLCSICAVFIGI
jgi:hypothetical protein